jgi:hypothetical protein
MGGYAYCFSQFLMLLSNQTKIFVGKRGMRGDKGDKR